MSARAWMSSGFTVFTTVMLGFAAGATWMVAMLYLRQPAPWLALLTGAWLAWVLRSWVHPAGLACAGLAALATTVAALWVRALLAAVQIGANMGLSLLDALHAAGVGMLWQLLWLGTATPDLVWAGGGIVLAAIIAARPRRP